MRKIGLLLSWFACIGISYAQKKPLDHTVYDGWQSIGERLISNNGNWIVYTINPQEGDNELVIQSYDAKYKKTIARGYNAVITEDSRYLIFKIRPLFKETRDAKIKKKKADEMPKDSLAIVELGKDNIWKTPRVKNYATPSESEGWLVYHLDKKPDQVKKSVAAADKKQLDSLSRVIDSLKSVITSLSPKSNRDNGTDADEDDAAASAGAEGTDLVVRNLIKGEEKIIRNVTEYLFSKNGYKLLIEQVKDTKDSLGKTVILCYDLRKGFADTLSRGGNAFAKFSFSDDATQMAWLAERDAKPKALQKFYKVWYYKEGMDTAIMLVDRNTTGMCVGSVVSENGDLSFSKNGRRLFFGTAPAQAAKDTNLVDIDLVKVDVWHYNDDYLQTTQLSRLRRDQQENFLAVYHLDQNKLEQLGSREIPLVIQTDEGNGDQFAGVTDYGKRIESQWSGTTKKDVYAINVNDGTKKLVKNDLQGVITPAYVSPGGKYIMWYDSKARHYFVWDGEQTRNITEKIKFPLYNEEHDSPSDPAPYGVMGWHEGDSAVYIYDRYDAWRIDPTRKAEPKVIAGGRFDKNTFRYLRYDTTQRFFTYTSPVYFRVQNQETWKTGIWCRNCLGDQKMIELISAEPVSIGGFLKAKKADVFAMTTENYKQSPTMVSFENESKNVEHSFFILPRQKNQLSNLNPQQENFNWGSAELFKWKAYTGKEVSGIVYKPEDFDPKKKYPMICYFYETHSETLNSYMPPAPTASRLNIPFFVSRGYIVFSPDIHYTTGHPGRDAYDHVVSGARALVKAGYVDSTRIGIQGQSWGGYQVAYLITVTNLFKAAWAGAPVANMTSAYGGIRWESGLNRQFQYEKTQSRIGATLWEKPQLYIENSPLFHLPKVKTPLVIMANDADGAVPWYQGIELFTGMRRLGKKVWMLNYNGEAHNLVERKNRKDIQVREQQFFDWLLKDEKPARWITDGVPAVNKGRDWGLDN